MVEQILTAGAICVAWTYGEAERLLTDRGSLNIGNALNKCVSDKYSMRTIAIGMPLSAAAIGA